MPAASLEVIRVVPVRASARSTWFFLEMKSADGFVGTGEAGVHGRDEDLAARMREMARSPEEFRAMDAFGPDAELVEVSTYCAFDQALRDIEAQRQGLPIHALLGTRRPRIASYANINRRTHDRSSAGFAQSASDALHAGHVSLKIAPFDGIRPDMDFDEAKPLLDVGFARIMAVRGVIGDRKLFVDCHGRLSPKFSAMVLGAAREAGVFWIEMPFREKTEYFSAIGAFRRAANTCGIQTAGGELMTDIAGFAPLLDGELYDVLMPDMKYVGGYDAFRRVCDAAAGRSIAIAPHNPTGPIAHAHTVHASAAIENFLILETQFDELAAFVEVVDGNASLPRNGEILVSNAPGLGASLARDFGRWLS